MRQSVRLEIVMAKSEYWLLIAMNFHDIQSRFKARPPHHCKAFPYFQLQHSGKQKKKIRLDQLSYLGVSIDTLRPLAESLNPFHNFFFFPHNVHKR